jgi:hypothetical protein
MRKTILTVGMGLLCFGYITSEVPSSEGRPVRGSIQFNYDILEPNPSKSYVRTRGDTVSFRLYYVDTDCSSYDYYLFARSDSLIVCRTSARGGDCNPEAQSLYGVEGVAANVPPGRYQFILQSTWGSTAETLFRDIVDVKQLGG